MVRKTENKRGKGGREKGREGGEGAREGGKGGGRRIINIKIGEEMCGRLFFFSAVTCIWQLVSMPMLWILWERTDGSTGQPALKQQ